MILLHPNPLGVYDVSLWGSPLLDWTLDMRRTAPAGDSSKQWSAKRAGLERLSGRRVCGSVGAGLAPRSSAAARSLAGPRSSAARGSSAGSWLSEGSYLSAGPCPSAEVLAVSTGAFGWGSVLWGLVVSGSAARQAACSRERSARGSAGRALGRAARSGQRGASTSGPPSARRSRP